MSSISFCLDRLRLEFSVHRGIIGTFRNGTCFTTVECSSRAGTAAGTCAGGQVNYSSSNYPTRLVTIWVSQKTIDEFWLFRNVDWWFLWLKDWEMTGRCPDVRSNKYIFAFNISDSAFAAYFWSVARVLMLTGIAHTFKTLVFPHLPPQQLPCPTPFPSAVAVCWLLNMYFNRRI